MKNFLVTLVLALLSCFAPQSSFAGIGDSLGLSPFWEWRTIDTLNFRITFPKQIEPQAKKAARLFEEANRVLSAELQWYPRAKVNVLLIDNADSANGMASPVLRFGMILYVTPPDNWMSIHYYDDWLKLLIFHEYTHFLNMDPTRGLYTFFRFMFGDIFLPNTLWPSWMLEGLATFMETKYSATGGRGRSTYYDMVLRAAVDAGKLDSSDWMNINRVAAPIPHHPGGETPYMFGYHLMNEVHRHQPEALGEMSQRSSQRVPFFINGNLENITGKDWYDFWDSFVVRARAKAEKDLLTLRQAGVTPYEVLDGTTFETLGMAASPDGRFIAYSHEDPDHWQTLRLKDVPSGKVRTIEDKFSGVSLAFTPDSRIVVHSSLRRSGNYNLFSDLKAYDTQSGKSYWITRDARARDPDVSSDGKRIAFTSVGETGVHLQWAEITQKDGKIHLKNSRRIFKVGSLDRVSTPKFSPDGQFIAFTLKRNGEPGENLMRFSIATEKTESLIADGHFHRFPAYAPGGELYFVSNRTGVDNLYRYDGKAGIQVTNLTGGLILPTFSRDKLYGSFFSWKGWSLGSVALEAIESPYDSAALTIAPPEAPAPVDTSQAADSSEYSSRPYTPWASLLPRQWAPLVLLSEERNYLGGQISGYDQTFRHTYILGLFYDETVGNFDHIAVYQNRSLGVNIDLYSTRLTSNVTKISTANPERISYSLDTTAGAQISYPFQFITSVLEPAIGAAIERDSEFDRVSGANSTSWRSRYVPTQDVSVTYGLSRASRKAATIEKGRVLFAGVRRYDDSEIENYKMLGKYAEYIHLGNHFVLIPTLRGVRVTKENPRFLDANAVISGDRDAFGMIPGDGFDEFGIRGYSRVLIAERAAYTGALDLRFPMAQIFRSWGTNPVVLKQLTGNVFFENAHIPAFPSAIRNLYSAGAGLRLSTQLLSVLPLSFGIEYQKGLNDRIRTEDEVFFTLNVNALPFEF